MDKKMSEFSVGAVALAFGNIARHLYRCTAQLLA
jgi:hypothetical protein